MRFLVTVPAGNESEAAKRPDASLVAAMQRFNEQLVKAGVMVAAEGLHPTSKGARIRYDAPGKTAVTDGPFTDSKELIAGFWIIETKSKDEAIAWMKKAPFGGGVELQLRQIFESADFAATLPPEQRAAEERLRAELDAQRRKR